MKRKLAVMTLVVITAFTGLSSAPAQAEDTGTITGHLTDGDQPLRGASVYARTTDWSSSGYGYTDYDGAYRIQNLKPGTYVVSFTTSPGIEQYAYGKTDMSSADKFTVAAGAEVTVNDSLLPTATVTGKYVDRNGNGVANANVLLQPRGTNGARPAFGTTAMDGSFTLRTFPGKFSVSFAPRLGYSQAFQQWVPGKLNLDGATVFDLAGGSTTTVNETMVPTGSVSGRFTATDGTGLPVQVILEGNATSVFTMADTNGNYTLPLVPAADWRVHYYYWNPHVEQFATGVLDRKDATVFTVAEGQNLVVNDSRLPVGSLKVVAKDESDGSPIQEFYADLGNAGYGNASNGEAIVTDVPAGARTLTVTSYGFYPNKSTVTVTKDQQTEVTVMMKRRPRLNVTVVDSATGAPVSGVCVLPMPVLDVHTTDACPRPSGPDGKATIEVESAGWINVFAFAAGAHGYGAQWVGWTGGTGNQLLAKLFKAEDGKAVNVTIKMDHAGTITGKITEADGSAPSNVSISVMPGGISDGGGMGYSYADREGNYTVDFLGPYQWPLLFQGSHGLQYSGGTGTRIVAQKVAVTAGGTTTYNFAFKPTATLAVHFTSPPVNGGCEVFAYNAFTGDFIGLGYGGDGGPVCVANVPLAGPTAVKLKTLKAGDDWPPKWVGGDDFAHATLVTVPANGTKDVTVP